MSVKTLSWIMVAAAAVGAALLFNYWVSYQWLSLLAYAGIVVGLFGLVNVAVPFRFLGIRSRGVGAGVLALGVAVTVLALLWPASIVRVAQAKTTLDNVLPQYQFSERHSLCIHARPEQVLQAVRESTFGDMRSLNVLLKIRGAGLREGGRDSEALARDKRILDAFAASGYVVGGNDRELVMAGGANVRAQKPLAVRSLQEFTDCREHGVVKMAFDFTVEPVGDGWSVVTAETRVLALDETGRVMARYWRLIAPGSGMLRRQWLDGIRRRAERG